LKALIKEICHEPKVPSSLSGLPSHQWIGNNHDHRHASIQIAMAFHPIDRDTDYLLPPSEQEWLSEPHLARYVVDVVEGLDLSELERA
jgi:hypothetical protein